MTFEFYPLRFEFIARDSLFFPPGKAANILRGALGLIFRRIACLPHCLDARGCEARESCCYARVFEPMAGPSPSGLADWPRPFVFRARHLDGRMVEAGASFHFDLHVFLSEHDVLRSFILTFAELASEGLGPRRGRAELLRVRRLSAEGFPEEMLYADSVEMIAAELRPVSLDLAARPEAPARIRVEFLSPTELKQEDQIASRPEFPILFGRARDRISTLRRLYGAGPLDIDYLGTNARAGLVRMTRCEWKRQEVERRSSRSGRRHSIGGFVGCAEYEGELAEFLPYLRAAEWTGIGRQSVWGKGEIAVEFDGSGKLRPAPRVPLL